MVMLTKLDTPNIMASAASNQSIKMHMKKSNQRLLKQIPSKPKMPAIKPITSLLHFLFALSENVYILIIVTTTKQPTPIEAERLDK